MNLESVKDFVKHNAGTILTVISCAGVIGTAVCAAHDAVKARDVMLEIEMEHDDLPKSEVVKRVVPCYISTVLMAGATIACVIGHHQISAGKIAAYASAYTMAAKAASEYRTKIVEELGKEKAQEIDDEISKEHIRKNPPSDQDLIPGIGDILCYDQLMDRYFHSDPESIRKVVNDLNYELINGPGMWVGLNEFYDKLGLDPAPIGEELGWTIDNRIDVSFSSMLSNNNIPCLVMRFATSPVADTTRRY